MYEVSKESVLKVLIQELAWTDEHSSDGEANFALSHHEGVVRGIIWAYTGKDPGSRLLHNSEQIFKLMKIPYINTGTHYIYDNGDGDWDEVVAE